MKKVLVAVVLTMVSAYANAAYYFNLGDKGKLTISKDLKTAVVVNGDQVIRTTLGKAFTEDIDNGGRPYNLSIYYNESCNSFKECDKPLLGIKNYNDKVKGFSIWMSEPITNKILWQKELTERDLITD
ncbi:hypothetical protein [Pantoea sp. S62]|uniref:hypothetical protein n=1 Tax=Pantoea sp. S62 TaxID=2769342 RepID=UPI001913E651|nr:hypothetical protein [Pantoea sp. S62]MBK5013987.1 hypothetical protein [Pantoea sp. S62]